MSAKLDTLRKAYHDLQASKSALEVAAQTAFPVGASVCWKRNHNVQAGRVLRHGYQDRLYVKNQETLAEYWIRVSDILRAGE